MGSQSSSGFPMMDSVATGSTAEISAPKRRLASGAGTRQRAVGHEGARGTAGSNRRRAPLQRAGGVHGDPSSLGKSVGQPADDERGNERPNHGEKNNGAARKGRDSDGHGPGTGTRRPGAQKGQHARKIAEELFLRGEGRRWRCRPSGCQCLLPAARRDPAGAGSPHLLQGVPGLENYRGQKEEEEQLGLHAQRGACSRVSARPAAQSGFPPWGTAGPHVEAEQRELRLVRDEAGDATDDCPDLRRGDLGDESPPQWAAPAARRRKRTTIAAADSGM